MTLRSTVQNNFYRLSLTSFGSGPLVLALCAFLLAAVPAFAQPFLITDGADNTCVGAFLDSGGQGAVGYSNNEDETYTLCPDAAGNLLSLSFVTFNLALGGNAPIDNLTIYDGATTGAPLIGSFIGNALQGQTISASAANASGCLTFVWHSNNTGTGVFAASIHCYQPCVPPVASAVMNQTAPARICVGEQVNFNGSSSTAQPGLSISNYDWDFDDGTSLTTAVPNTSHIFNTPGVHTVQLTVTDNNGCQSLNRIDLQVWVGTVPTFTGTTGASSACANETLCLTGVVNAVEYDDDPETTYGNGIFIPDDVGSCFEAHIYLTQFAPGATLTNINQLLGLCLNIEHSWLGDLVMTITSPSGESVILHQQGITTETFLGQPTDPDEGSPQPGTCEQYCFANASPNGTMANYANANSSGLGWTLPPGTYQSLFPLTGLVGSQLNGLWTLTICDMWDLDNGFLCDWSIDFDPSLYANITSYTPQYGAACDSTWWTGPGIVSTGPGCEQICVQQGTPGTYNYVYHATDDFGCTFDTTLSITIAQPIVVDAGANVQICNGNNTQLSGTVISGGLPPPPCDYELDLFDSFGDGWDGAAIGIVVNGVEQDWTLNNGPAGAVYFTVNDGDAVQLIYYPSALYNNEHSYELYDATGALVFADTPPFVNGVTWNGIADCGPPPGFIYTWTPATGLSDPNIANPIATPGGTTTYTLTVSQAGHPNCTGSDQVTVTVTTPVNAGTDGSITVCANAAVFNLFPLLGGTPAAGGTWTGPGGVANNGTFTPGTSSPGVYTYSVNGNAQCPGVDQSTITVNVVNPPNAGTDATISVCTSNLATNLSTLITGAMGGGTWTTPTGTAFTGWYDPSVNDPGVYTYTVTGTAPCPNDQSQVTVTESTAPNAGLDGTITVCSNGSSFLLFNSLGGSPGFGGMWTAPGGIAHNGTFVPGTDPAGVYQYTLTSNPPCLPDVATVTVTVVQPPNAGTDGALTVCSNGANTDLFTQLGGAQAGGTWTDPSGAAHSNTFVPGTDAAGVYTYTVAGTAPCANDQATVTVTVIQPPNAGTDGVITVCSNDANADLIAQLGGAQAGGTWTDPSGAAHSSTFVPGTDAAGVYTYTVAGTAPCANDQATVTVTVVQPPNAGTDGVLTVCSNGANTDLFTQLGGAQAGGTWTDPSGAAHSNAFVPGTDAAGVYTYTVAGTAPCANDQATVTVTVIQPPNAGTDGVLTVCSNGANADLFAQLGGAQAGGTWTDPSGAAHSSTFVPGTDAAGVYTYTVAGTAPCANDQATVTVTVVQPPNAGTDGVLTVCSNGANTDLFTQLGGAQAGGTWTDPSGAAHTNTFVPGTDAAGVYTYTVAGAAPCANDQATVTVTVVQPPDAGADGATTLCSTGVPVALYSYLSGSQAGGTWSYNTAPHGAVFDPSVDAAGIYTYTLQGTAPCANDQAQVIISVNQQPDAGTNGAVILCVSSPAIDLFSLIGGAPQAGGTWTAPNGAAHSSMFTPGVDAVGTYAYTVNGTAPCPSAQATVDVTVTSEPDAGTNASITICANASAFDLFGALGGSPDAGGTWTLNGAPHGSQFDPLVDAAGVYTYTITVPPPCTNQSATVTVAIVQPPNAGTDGNSLLCISSPALDLFDELGGAQPGGSWTFNGAPHGNTFTPGTDMPGVYTYTVNGTAPCANDQATVTVAVTSDPDPGTDGVITLCASGVPVDLFASLGGTPDAGGTWSFNGSPHSSTIDPSVDAAGVYTYTVSVPPPCTSQSATVTVTIVQPPDAGSDGNTLLCISSPALDLFTQLTGAQAGGAWSFNGGAHNNTFVPGTDVPGVYTYTVAGTSPCPNDQSTVTVAVTSNPDPGTNGAITLCASSAAMDLFATLGGTPDAGGTWTHSGAAHSNLFDPALDAPGIYTYTVAAPPPCTSQSSTVTVTIVQPPNAGGDGSTLLCISSPALDLFTQLGGAQAGGSWSFNGNAHSNTFTPGTDVAGVYTYSIAGTAPCPADQSTVTVAVTNNPDPGTNGAVVVCANGSAVDLFAQIGGTPDAGGSWTYNGNAHGSTFDPAIDAAGVYTYTITVPPPCQNASSTVTVLVQAPPDAGLDGTLTLCSTSATTALFPVLTGAQAGGTWNFQGNAHNGTFQPNTDVAGVYTYTVAGTAPCTSDQSTVTVTVNQPPNAGADGSLTVCSTGSAVDLFTLLGGTPATGGSWSQNGVAHANTYDPSVDASGSFTYTVTGNAPCPSDAASVTITEVDPPDAGADGSITLCSTGAAIDLFAQLGGVPAAGGSWNGPSPVTASQFDPTSMLAGTYTYTVMGTAPCPSDASQVVIAITPAPDPGGDGALLLCIGGSAVDLFAQLTGTPEAGGAWSFNGAAHTSTFDPAVDANGIYTYTLSGTAPCPNASANVTMTVTASPDAGTPGNTTLCASDAALPLLGLLGGTPDAGGTWTDANGIAHGTTFDPSTDQPGVYTYTINVPPPCVSTSSSVTIGVLQPSDPGVDGALTLCTTSAPIDLSGQLGGTPDAGGQWTLNGNAHGSMFDPTADAAGAYTYTVTSAAPCPSVSATVQVSLNAPPNAGTDGVVTLCISSSPIDLFAQVGGAPQSGGAWSFNGALHAATFDPAIDLSGDYVYTVSGNAPCPSASSVVTVNVVSAPDPGINGTITLCESDTPADLLAQLGGTPDAGGTWSGPSAVVGGSFDPASMSAGTYTYTINVPPPCSSVSSEVLVTVQNLPEPGTNGASILCATSTAADLFTLLGGTPQPGGTWTDPSGQPHLALFNPATDAQGSYTYTVPGTQPCPAASAQVVMTVTSNPDPGTNGAATLCVSDLAIDLFDQLGGTPDIGGTWSGPSAAPNGAFDPSTMEAGLYTYTITVPPPCVSASSSVMITVQQPADPGTGGATVVCISQTPVDLFSSLGGTPDVPGVWSFNGTTHGNYFDPAIDAAGDYVYTVAGNAPCPSASAPVSVTVVTDPDAGTDGAITLCTSGATTDLFTLLGGTPDAGGTWSGPSAVVSGQFEPGTMSAGTYTYTITVPPPCTSTSSQVVVNLVQPPDPGEDGALTLCSVSSETDLFVVLGGTPDAGGTWSYNGSAHASSYDPAQDAPGSYTYTVVGTLACPASTASVIVSELLPPEAGANGTLNLCISGPPVDLNTALSGADPNGSWTAPNGQPFTTLFDPSTATTGAYTYTVQGTAPCPNDQSVIMVNVFSNPNAGLDGANTLCTTGSAIDLFAQLGGSPNNGGFWIAPNGQAHAAAFDPATDAAGSYAYVIDVPPPCVGDTAMVTLSLVQPPDAGLDGSITLCANGTAIDLFAQLGGAPDTGGTWTAPNGSASDASFDPTTEPEGTYTYTVQATQPCSNAAAVVFVEVSDPITGGAMTQNAICHDACDGSAVLNVNGGTPAYSFTWSGNVAGAQDSTAIGLCAGTFSVNITDASGCTGTIGFTISEPPQLVIDAIGTGDENCPDACDGNLNVVDNQGVLFSLDGGTTWQSSGLFSDLCPGGYTVLMLDANGCEASAPAAIQPGDPVIAEFYATPDTTSVSNTLISFTNLSGNANTFSWNFGGLATSVEGAPSYAFPHVLGGVYDVCLLATNNNGCQDSICHPVVILDELIVHVPNAFTPNGDDINEGFVPIFNIPAFVGDYEFMIFDRWGELIFESNTVGQHWNGTMGGEVVKEEVYVWKLKFRDIITHERHDRIGHVTLLK